MKRRKTGGRSAKSRGRKNVKRRARAPARQRDLPKSKDTSVARFRRERDEALEQQAATSEVLRVISASPDDLEPVFDTILENATRLCEARFGTLNLYDGQAYQSVALHNPPPQFVARKGEVIHPLRKAASPMSPGPERLRTLTIFGPAGLTWKGTRRSSVLPISPERARF